MYTAPKNIRSHTGHLARILHVEHLARILHVEHLARILHVEHLARILHVAHRHELAVADGARTRGHEPMVPGTHARTDGCGNTLTVPVDRKGEDEQIINFCEFFKLGVDNEIFILYNVYSKDNPLSKSEMEGNKRR